MGTITNKDIVKTFVFGNLMRLSPIQASCKDVRPRDGHNKVLSSSALVEFRLPEAVLRYIDSHYCSRTCRHWL